MQKILFLLPFVLISFSIKASKAEIFEGYYVTNSLDTIVAVFPLSKEQRVVHFLTSELREFPLILKTVVLRDHEGVKKFKPRDINSFVIYIPNEGIHRFVSLDKYGKIGRTGAFYYERINGKISLYISYDRGSVTGTLSQFSVLRKGDEFVDFDLFGSKERVADLLQDNSTVWEKWTTRKRSALTTRYDTIEKLIREYNEAAANEETVDSASSAELKITTEESNDEDF